RRRAELQSGDGGGGRADGRADAARRRARRVVARGGRHSRHLCRPRGACRSRRPAAEDLTTPDRAGTHHMAANQNWRPLERDALAARLAQDIPEGWSVNLGIGIPTLVGNYVPSEREVIFHSENGILGMGPAPAPDKVNRWLINASSQYVTLRPGASYMSHSDSFALVRGGHLDLCVLGAYQVAENGDLANWAMTENDPAPQIGGAMDLAVGTKEVWVLMEHTTKDGRARIVHECTYPLTGKGVVTRVYTNLAVLDVTGRGFVVIDMIPGLTIEALQARTEAKLHLP